jgi:hypothetical protein
MSKRKVRLIATVLFLAFVGLALLMASKRSDRAVTSALAELKTLGFASTAAEFAPPVPEDANAAPLYEQAFRTLVTSAYAKPEVTKRLRDGQLPTAAEIASLEPVLSQAKAASERPLCQFPHDWSDPIKVNFKEYPELKKLLRALRVRANVRAKVGDATGAFDDIRTMLAISDHIAQGRSLIASLVQIAGRASTIATIEETITALGPKPSVLIQAREVLATMKPISPRAQFSGELLFERATVDAIRKAKPGEGFSVLGGEDSQASLGAQAFIVASKVPSLLNEMDLACLNTYIKLSKAMPSDPEDVTGLMKASTEVERDLNAKMAAKDLRYALASMIMPGFGGFAGTFGSDVARRRTLACLLDALAKTPRPTGLVTTGKNATDPYTGNRMLVRASAKEFVVYSVGQNLTDDGGDLKPSLRNDIVSAYPRAWSAER